MPPVRPYVPLSIPPDETPIWRDLAREWPLLGPHGGSHHWHGEPPFSPRDDRDVVAPPSETRPRVESPIDDHLARLDPPTRPLRAGGRPMDNELDTGDHVATEGDPDVVDPTPAEITDPAHTDYVEPAPHCTAIGEA